MSSPRFLSHRKLIKAMKLLGYPSNESGVCQGVAVMWTQACLCGEEEKFLKRLNLIANTPKLKTEIEDVKKKIKKATPQQTKDLKSFLNEKELLLLEVHPFLEGVDVFFNPSKYPEILGKNLRQIHEPDVATIIGSHELLKRGGLERVYSEPVIKTQQELTAYLNEFKHILKPHKMENYSLPILLGSSNHAIAIRYDYKNETWNLFDANAMPT